MSERNILPAVFTGLLLLHVTILLFAQQDTDTTFLNSDSSSLIHDSLPESTTAMAVQDTISNEGEATAISLGRKKAFYQNWKDQFPSPLIQYSYGSPPEKEYEIPRKQKREDWKFYLSFSLLGLLALIRFGYAKEFDELFSVFRNWGPSQQMYRELGTGVSFGTVLLNFFSVLVISLFIYLLLNWYGNLYVDPAWLLMIVAGAAVGLFMLARYALLKAASLLLPFRKEITLYNFYEIQINRILGVALFPLVLLITFSKQPVNEYALYAALIMVFAFILIRYMKGFNIGVNYFGRHVFHFLLYICALEIAPLLIIIRLLQNLGPLRFSL